MARFAQRAIGAVLFGIAASLIILVLAYLLFVMMDVFDIGRARLRIPVAFFVLPFIGAIAGWKMGPDLFGLARPMWRTSITFRAAIMLPTFWVLLVLTTIFIFEPGPFRGGFNRMSDADIELLVKLLIFPPAVLGGVFGVYRLIIGNQK